jgi:hypothetical protein
VVGAAGGVILFGPVFGVILGLLANYAAKADNEVGEAARGVGKTALELLNYVNKVNSKYEITNKVGDATGKLYTKIKEQEGDDSVITKLEEVCGVCISACVSASPMLGRLDWTNWTGLDWTGPGTD